MNEIWLVVIKASLLLLIFGIGLLLIKRCKSNWRNLGFAIFSFGIFVLFEYFPEYSQTFSIWATVLLAIAAYATIDESRRFRLQGAQQDLKTRKREMLGTVINWGVDILKSENETQLVPLPAEKLIEMKNPEAVKVVIAYHDTVIRSNLTMKYQKVDANTEYVLALTKSLDEQYQSNLSQSVEKTANLLAKHIDTCTDLVKSLISEEEYKKRWEELLAITKAMIKEAVKLL